MGGGGRSCIVVGCKSRTTDCKSKHFYKFPKDSRREIWITFTRRGQDFVPRESSVVCQDHFDPSCYVYKRKQQCLAKNSIPTIFFRETAEGLEKIVLTFDQDIQHYVEEDTLLNPAFDKDKCERELLEKRQRKLSEINNLCRFCFENQEEGVAITRMKDYGISPNDMLTLIGINTEFNDVFSKNVCEECFQQIVSIDGYRKRCQKAQSQLIDDMRTLDENIQKLRKNACPDDAWFKPEETWEESDDGVEGDSEMIVCEPTGKEENFHQINIKDEFDNFELNDDFLANESENEISRLTEETEPSRFIDDDGLRLSVEKIRKSAKCKPLKSLDSGERKKPQDSRPVNQRTYECFFCHSNFDGSANFKTHDCPVKCLVCEVQGCGRMFTALSGFNAHITKLHKLPKITRMYCSICRFSQVTNEEDFKDHTRQCEKSMGKRIDDSAITCETCGKFCPTSKSFSIHLMFHKITQPFQPQPKWKKAKRGVYICESCGKEFATPRYLKDHVKRLHTEPDKNPTIFTCDLCGKTRTSRYALNKHIKTVHLVAPMACKVCGKVFKNKTLVHAHMLYHREEKRIHFCALCPDKPPYWTSVALKRHQESNHGFGQGYQCEVCLATYRTQPGLYQHKAAAHGYTRTPRTVFERQSAAV